MNRRHRKCPNLALPIPDPLNPCLFKKSVVPFIPHNKPKPYVPPKPGPSPSPSPTPAPPEPTPPFREPGSGSLPLRVAKAAAEKALEEEPSVPEPDGDIELQEREPLLSRDQPELELPRERITEFAPEPEVIVPEPVLRTPRPPVFTQSDNPTLFEAVEEIPTRYEAFEIEPAGMINDLGGGNIFSSIGSQTGISTNGSGDLFTEADANRAFGLNEEGTDFLAEGEFVRPTNFEYMSKGAGRLSEAGGAISVAGFGLTSYDVYDIYEHEGAKKAGIYAGEAVGTAAAIGGAALGTCAVQPELCPFIMGGLTLAGAVGLGFQAKSTYDRDQYYKQLEKRKEIIEKQKQQAQKILEYSRRPIYAPKGVSDDDLRKGFVGVYDQARGGYVFKPIKELDPGDLDAIANNDNEDGKYYYWNDTRNTIKTIFETPGATITKDGDFVISTDENQERGDLRFIKDDRDGLYKYESTPDEAFDEMEAERAERAEREKPTKAELEAADYNRETNSNLGAGQLEAMRQQYLKDPSIIERQYAHNPFKHDAFLQYVDDMADKPKPTKVTWDKEGGESFYDFIERYNETPRVTSPPVATVAAPVATD